MRYSYQTAIALIVLLFCFTGSTVMGQQYFQDYVGYSVGAYPIGIASADFNEDSIPDLVTTNNPGSTISVLLGQGNGSFATQTQYPTNPSQYPYYVATGDIDQDGHVDIVATGSYSIVIFYGAGDGNFSTADVHNIGQSSLDIIVTDINNDDYPDIITSHAVRDSVGISINNHDSTFTTHFIATGYGTVSLAAGNLNGDAYLDFMVGCSQGTAWQLINDQAGDFVATEIHIGLLNDPADVVVADLDGDNLDDFVVTHAVNDFMFPYFNNGDGTYTVGSAHILTDNPINIEYADVDLDLDNDLLVSIGTTDDIELFLNDGAGTFTFDTAYHLGGTPQDLVLADFDDDGYDDIAASLYTLDMAGIMLSRLSLILDVEEIETGGNLPTDFSLEQNYPNPFNPETRIRFTLPQPSQVKIELFNTLGQSVATLADQYLSAGVKEVVWNGKDGSGDKVASGIYFYRLTTGEYTETRQMVLLK